MGLSFYLQRQITRKRGLLLTNKKQADQDFDMPNALYPASHKSRMLEIDETSTSLNWHTLSSLSTPEFSGTET